jgi:hypothetical protein
MSLKKEYFIKKKRFIFILESLLSSADGSLIEFVDAKRERKILLR